MRIPTSLIDDDSAIRRQRRRLRPLAALLGWVRKGSGRTDSRTDVTIIVVGAGEEMGEHRGLMMAGGTSVARHLRRMIPDAGRLQGHQGYHRCNDLGGIAEDLRTGCHPILVYLLVHRFRLRLRMAQGLRKTHTYPRTRQKGAMRDLPLPPTHAMIETGETTEIAITRQHTGIGIKIETTTVASGIPTITRCHQFMTTGERTVVV